MKKFVTTRGCSSGLAPQRRFSFHEVLTIHEEATPGRWKVEPLGAEVLENDSGVEVSDNSEDCPKSSTSTTLKSSADNLEYSSLRCDSNISESLVTLNSDLFQRVHGLDTIRQHISLCSGSEISAICNPEVKTCTSCFLSNSKMSLGSSCALHAGRKYIKRHEAAFYHVHRKNNSHPSGCRDVIIHSLPSLTEISPASPGSSRHVIVQSAPHLHERPTSAVHRSLSSIAGTDESRHSEDKREQMSQIYRKSKRLRQFNSNLSLPRKRGLQTALASATTKRRWCSSEALPQHTLSKLPEIIKECTKDGMTSSSISLIRGKYLGAEDLPETLEDVFLLTNLLKRFASSDPPNKVISLDQFKAQRSVCKGAIRQFTSSIRDAILNYESRTFIDSCRSSCCLSYADVALSSCCLLDYLSVPGDRNELAMKVSTVGTTFCRAAILANSSFGKHSSEKSSRKFFESTDRLIQGLNDLVLHIRNLRQNSISRKF